MFNLESIGDLGPLTVLHSQPVSSCHDFTPDMRDWLADCGVGAAYRMPASRVHELIEREFCGGVMGFLASEGV